MTTADLASAAQREPKSDSHTAKDFPSARPLYKWAVVGMLWFVCFLNYADRMAISSALPLLEQKYDFNKEQLGLISSAFMWVYALTAPMAGQAVDRLSRKMLILGGLFVWSFVTGLTALCTKVWQFVFVRGFEGFGETFYFPASMSLVSDYHGPSTRSRAMSIHQTSVYAGTIAGSIGTAWLIDPAGLALPWQAPFLGFGAAGVVLAFALWFFVREPGRNEAQRREAFEQYIDGKSLPGAPRQVPLSQFLPDLVRTPTVFLLMLAFVAANLVAGVILSWTTTFIFETFGGRLEGFGPSLFLASVVAMLSIQLGSMAGSVLAESRPISRAVDGRQAGCSFKQSACWPEDPFLRPADWSENCGSLAFACSCWDSARGYMIQIYGLLCMISSIRHAAEPLLD